MVILTTAYTGIPICKKEVLRYAGCKETDEQTDKLLEECIAEAEGKINGRACYTILPVTVSGSVCDFGYLKLRSENLARNLEGCERAVVFAATVGVEMDRLIQRYGKISPARALMLQAIGTERIEALCDTFCADIEKKTGKALKPRFSAGYGDLPLEAQRDVFLLLNPQKHIGLTLNGSLLMSPSKSVTAFAGIQSDEAAESYDKCELCTKKDCAYKRGIT